MKKDKLDQYLQSKLASYEQTPPDDLWAAIEASTTARPSLLRRFALPAFYATGIAAMVCVAFLLPHGNDDMAPLEEMVSKATTQPKAEEVERIAEEDVVEPVELPSQLASVSAVSKKNKVVQTEELQDTHASSVDSATQSEEESETTDSPAMVAETDSKATEHVMKEYTSPRTSQSSSNLNQLVAQNARHHTPMSVSAYMSMAHRNTSNSHAGMPFYMLSSDYLSTDGYMGNSMIPQVKMEEHHFVPLTFGADVRIPLAHSLGIQTGLSYSLLSSTFTYSDNGAEVHQKAHFIGIPIALTYDIVRFNSFDIYASAGGSIQKCVSATDDWDSTLDHPFQYALNCAAGIEYNITPHVGLYLQPELRYNIKNSTSLHTAYTSHPLNFTLKMGVTFSK